MFVNLKFEKFVVVMAVVMDSKDYKIRQNFLSIAWTWSDLIYLKILLFPGQINFLIDFIHLCKALIDIQDEIGNPFNLHVLNEFMCFILQIVH